MESIVHDLRLSETIVPFGVGAIVDVLGESLVAPDTSWWDRKYAPEIVCERLLASLGPGILREAPTHAGHAGKKTASLLYWRFPTWRFCERCQKLSRRTGTKKGRWTNSCSCGGFLVPMRYVAVCNQGSHLQDIPWLKWAHRGHDAGVTDVVRHCHAYNELKFVRSADRGEGLASLEVYCNACERARPLSDLVEDHGLQRDGIRCEGRQPWEASSGRTTCDHRLVAVQRGATGNYIAERVSALDVPEGVMPSALKTEQIKGHALFGRVVADNRGPQAEMVAAWIAEELGVTDEVVLSAADESDGSAERVTDLKDAEWAAFLTKLEAGRDTTGGDFVVDGWIPSTSMVAPSLTSVIAGVGQVRRVREVRALRGFRRYTAEADLVRADLGPDSRTAPVYPAIEVFGEGIFLRFDESRLREWESQAAVRARAEILVARRRANSWTQSMEIPEARFVALHTIAHLLIRRLAFASGYPSAALQERLYARSDGADPSAGILIYTAAGDAQGTLGGLVRLGQPKDLFDLLVSALADADVCSNDPVCIESDRQGPSHLNLSACHGCALVSETSCETSNRFLDRQLVLGGGGVPGLVETVLEEARGKVT